jgi:hypothetical protein
MKITDPVRVVVPGRLAERVAGACTLVMEDHQWAAGNVAAARAALTEPDGDALVAKLREHLAREGNGSGWAVVALPARLDDDGLRVTAAGVLALLGRPFNSIDQDGRLWIGGPSSPERDPRSFGGYGAQGLHVDAPNVQHVPDYTCLLVQQPDPAGGGQSLLGDLQAAMADTTEADREVLRRYAFFEGRADGLRGVGAPLLPFPVLDDAQGGPRPWIRWAAKLLDDARNAAHLAVLRRFAAAVEAHTLTVELGRGQLLIVDQQRIAHGRAALGSAHADGAAPRRLQQAKIRAEVDAPGQLLAELAAAPAVRHG